MLDQSSVDLLRDEPVASGNLFINGSWQQADEQLDVISPQSGTSLTSIALGQARDVELAVTAARAAFDRGVWSRAVPAFRKRVLHDIADAIESHALELAVLGVRDNGTEINTAITSEPGTAAATFRHSAECVDKLYGEIAPTGEDTLGLIHRVPVGVVGVILPWNFPLMIGAWKIAAALAAGNSVVIKPSEVASLTLLRLVEICMAAGLPEGVLNVVTGTGGTTGDALARHVDVDVLAFTGSGSVGRQLLEAAAQSNLKRVYLELGGKSPNVVFADAPDLGQAAIVSAKALFKNAGQICVAPSRLLVDARIRDKFIEQVVSHAESLCVGDPLSLDTDVGAIASADQMQRVLSFIGKAQEEGGVVLTGGEQIRTDSGGYFVAPTVIDEVNETATLFRQEVFGPVLSITSFDTEEEAIRLANATTYGLAAAVWTGNISRAHRMVAALQTGMVQVNGFGPVDNTAPIGGVKQSGNGVDKSLHAFDKYLNYKTAWFHL